MRFNRPAISCLLILALSGFSPATSFDKIRYCGGTISSRAGADEWDNTLTVAPEQIVLYLADGQRVKIDPDRVTNLSYGQEAHREFATLVDLGVIVAPVPLLGLLFASRQHFIGIEYTTAGGEKAGLLVQAHKDNYRAVLMALRGATHAPITVAEEDRRFIASAIGDAGLRTAPGTPEPASPSASSPTAASPGTAPVATPPAGSGVATPAPSSVATPAPATGDTTTLPPPATPGSVEKGTIHLTTTPSGAGINLNGRFVGQTPATLRLAPGRYTIRLSLDGAESWQQDIEVLEGSEVTLQIDLTKQ